MIKGPRLGLVLLAAILGAPAIPSATQPVRGPGPRPDFDIRAGRPAVPPRASVARPSRPLDGRGRVRLNAETGSVRTLPAPEMVVARASSPNAIRAALGQQAAALGLEPGDLATLTLVRDYVSRSTGARHVVFAQRIHGIPVFDSAVSVHLRPDGSVARITSNAAPEEGRRAAIAFSAADASRAAAADINSPLESPPAARLAWFPYNGVLNLAWHLTVDPADATDVYDFLFDTGTGELLLRRNRALYVDGFGRVLQSAAAQSHDPRMPDAMPIGSGGCPPPANYALRSLTAQFRDPATVLGDTGHLEGNNTRVFRRNTSTPSAAGVPDEGGLSFDFPFNSASSAETSLFFAMNFAHDFFYDLGFDEGAGNFQADNFGRGGLGGDPMRANARANGRNNANYVHADDGSSPIINMFLWDGIECWSEDVDGDGVNDIDGDYDLDVVLHEFHHGVSMRLNTSWTGNEARAIGEGGGDFFAYSVNDETTLAEYSRPGGLREVNDRTYESWFCQFGLFCEPHDNGEIWANVLWDVRERFRADLVRGSEAAAVGESHQIYVDGLKLSPPAPTMLDIRDAMLEADALRNPGTADSQNYCRIWEAFAGRGMGVSATDTQDNGFNVVGAAFDVPPGCVGPPPPPPPSTVTLSVTAATALEAGTVPGAVTITREPVRDIDLAVRYQATGSAFAGGDYTRLSGTATIPAGLASVTVPIVPIDDTTLENNETVVVTITNGPLYVVGTPASGVVTIVSDDVAADLIVSAFSGPPRSGAGATVQVSDTTKNQGTGSAPATQTSFYLSANGGLDSSDVLLGSRDIGPLPPGTSSTATTTLVLPDPLASGTYYLFAKADGPGTVSEVTEFNNTRAAIIAIGPDLIISALTGPASGAAGGVIAVSDTTLNAGAGAASESSTRFFLSGNGLLDSTDVPLQSRPVGVLPAGGASLAVTSVIIPASTTSGTYYLFAKADGGNALVEPNEINNTRAIAIRIGGDLTVSGLTAPSRAASGGTILVTDATKNLGAAPVDESTTAFYLSANLWLDASDIRLTAARVVPALGAGAQSIGSTTLAVPHVSPGTWYLLANADDGSVVPETQEANNVRFTTIQIGPDLTLLFVTVPFTAVSGTSITVSDTVKNIGASEVPATVVKFYLSSNNTVDPSDIVLAAERAVPPLAVNATHAGSTVVPIPSGVSGTWYLILVADGDQVVIESSELNNHTPRAIQISPGT
jgi:subtilase family serine protease